MARKYLASQNLYKTPLPYFLIKSCSIYSILSKTNLTILNSEKERHIEQNAIDKEYYEGQIKNLIKENEELKQEMKVKVSNFSSVIKEQEKSLENEYKIQLKSYKEIINRNEKEKKDLIKRSFSVSISLL